MAGTRQYAAGLASVPFDIFPDDTGVNTGPRRTGKTLDMFPAANVQVYTAAQLNTFPGLTQNTSGINLFDLENTVPFTKSAGLDYQLHVIRDMNFRMNGADNGVFTISGTGDNAPAGQGVHIIFVNCTFTAINPTANNGGNYWLTTNIASPSGTVSGRSPNTRPVDLSNRSLEDSRSFNFLGCTISLGSVGTTAPNYRMSAADIRDTIIIDPFSNTADLSEFTFIYSQPGSLIENSILTSHSSFTNTNGPQRMWLTGPTTLSNTDTRGYNLAVADVAQVEVFGLQGLPGLAVCGFNIGEAFNDTPFPNNGRTYMKSIDPVFAVPGTNTTVAAGTFTFNASGGNALTFRTGARYIELLRYRPEFHSAVDVTSPDVDGIYVRANYGISFNAGQVDNYVTATATPDTTNYDYFSSTSGRIEGTGHRPDLGGDGTLDGLAVPVAAYRTQNTTADSTISTRLEYGTSTITARGFWNNIPDADGETNITINRAALMARAADPDTAGTSLGLRVEAPLDTNLSTAAAATTRTVAGLNSYFNTTFTGTEAFTDQDVSDGFKALHYQYTAGVPFRTVSATGQASATLNLTYVTANATALNWDNTTNTFSVRGPAAASAADDPVQSLNITGAVNFGGQTVQGANITASAGLSNLQEGETNTAAQGGALAGAYTPTTVGATLRFEADADGNGVDLGGFTSTADVTITGRIAVAPRNLNNITQPQSVTISGYTSGSYIAAYDITNAVPNSLLVTLPSAPAAGNITADDFLVSNLTTGDMIRVVITHRDREDVVINHTVSGVASENVLTLGVGTTPAQLPQATPTDPTDVTGISLTTAIAAGTGAATTLNITINGATASVASGNSLSDTQSYGFLTRAKNTASYNQLIAERNDTTVQIYQPAGVESPGGIFAPAVLIIPGAPDFQQLGFVNPVRPAGDTTSVLADDIAAGSGVLILPTASFDLPLTVSSLQNVINDTTPGGFVDNITDPAINAIRNFLQLSDN